MCPSGDKSSHSSSIWPRGDIRRRNWLVSLICRNSIKRSTLAELVVIHYFVFWQLLILKDPHSSPKQHLDRISELFAPDIVSILNVYQHMFFSVACLSCRSIENVRKCSQEPVWSLCDYFLQDLDEPSEYVHNRQSVITEDDNMQMERWDISARYCICFWTKHSLCFSMNPIQSFPPTPTPMCRPTVQLSPQPERSRDEIYPTEQEENSTTNMIVIQSRPSKSTHTSKGMRIWFWIFRINYFMP